MRWEAQTLTQLTKTCLNWHTQRPSSDPRPPPSPASCTSGTGSPALYRRIRVRPQRPPLSGASTWGTSASCWCRSPWGTCGRLSGSRGPRNYGNTKQSQKYSAMKIFHMVDRYYVTAWRGHAWTDPGFPIGGGANPREGPTYDFAKISKKKLHKIEKILDHRRRLRGPSVTDM